MLPSMDGDSPTKRQRLGGWDQVPMAQQVPMPGQMDMAAAASTAVFQLAQQQQGGVRPLPEQMRGANGSCRLCNNWKSGSCFRGSACTFAHGEEEVAAWNAALLQARTAGQPLGGDHSTVRPYPPAMIGRSGPIQLCKHYTTSGACPKSTNCTFAHGELERQSWEAEKQNTQNQLPPMMTGSSLPPREPPAALLQAGTVKICHHQQAGNCFRGAGCTFAHSVEEQQIWERARLDAQRALAAQQADPMGLYAAAGYAPAPAAIRARPDSARQGHYKMCRKYESEGHCSYGVRCTFAHGAEELSAWNSPGEIVVEAAPADAVYMGAGPMPLAQQPQDPTQMMMMQQLAQLQQVQGIPGVPQMYQAQPPQVADPYGATDPSAMYQVQIAPGSVPAYMQMAPGSVPMASMQMGQMGQMGQMVMPMATGPSPASNGHPLAYAYPPQ